MVWTSNWRRKLAAPTTAVRDRPQGSRNLRLLAQTRAKPTTLRQAAVRAFDSPIRPVRRLGSPRPPGNRSTRTRPALDRRSRADRLRAKQRR